VAGNGFEEALNKDGTCWHGQHFWDIGKI